MTRFALTSARANLFGLPDCGKHVTLKRWACRVTAQSTTGPFAGRILTYRCSATVDEQAAARTINCGPEPLPRITGAGSS